MVPTKDAVVIQYSEHEDATVKFKSRLRDLRAARGLTSCNFFHTARVRIPAERLSQWEIGPPLR